MSNSNRDIWDRGENATPAVGRRRKDRLKFKSNVSRCGCIDGKNAPSRWFRIRRVGGLDPEFAFGNTFKKQKLDEGTVEGNDTIVLVLLCRAT
jgi:hypothetical protein